MRIFLSSAGAAGLTPLADDSYSCSEKFEHGRPTAQKKKPPAHDARTARRYFDFFRIVGMMTGRRNVLADISEAAIICARDMGRFRQYRCRNFANLVS